MSRFADKTGSYWVATSPQANFPQLTGHHSVDVAIVGGGIVGLTAAALLAQAGRSVAVIEALQLGGQATGHSTAKVTSQHSVIYSQLIKTHGEDGARAYAEANQAAVERVATFVDELAIDCDFERQDAYVFTRDGEKTRVLEKEAEVASRLGQPASIIYGTAGELPFETAAALRFSDQAQFNPSKYLVGLANAISAANCQIFERSRVTNVESGNPWRVTTERGTATARDVIIATHLPVVSQGMYFAKAYPHTIPIVAAPVDSFHAPKGMFISIDAPKLSVVTATQDGQAYLIAAGEQFKTGHTEAGREQMAALEQELRDYFGVREIAYRWTNHDYMSMDRVPFVGKASAGTDHLYVATGFGAWGLSNGTAAAMILADIIAGRKNPWAELFDSTRKKPLVSAPKFLAENFGAAAHLAGGYLSKRPTSPESLQPGEAGIFNVGGAKTACHRDRDGVLHQVSAVCTHLKCIVGWNSTEETWDCPCHGSRFTREGQVIHGPAVDPLEPSR